MSRSDAPVASVGRALRYRFAKHPKTSHIHFCAQCIYNRRTVLREKRPTLMSLDSPPLESRGGSYLWFLLFTHLNIVSGWVRTLEVSYGDIGVWRFYMMGAELLYVTTPNAKGFSA